MEKGKGYVVVGARGVLFEGDVERVMVGKRLYEVSVRLGKKKILLEGKEGKRVMRGRIEGVVEMVKGGKDMK